MQHVNILFCGRKDRVLFGGRQSSRISVGVRLLLGGGVAKVYTTRSFPKNITFSTGYRHESSSSSSSSSMAVNLITNFKLFQSCRDGLGLRHWQ